MTTENDVVTTPAQEEQKPEETVTPQEPKEETVGEVLHEKPQVDTIPKARLDKEIAKRKDLERELEALKAKATDEGMTKSEVSTSLKALAEQHNIDPSFLSQLATAIKAETEASFEEKIRPFTEKEKQARIDQAFSTNFAKTMANLPEYEGLVNEQVIKTLSLQPANANKTFRQLIEETYGNALAGRKTTERAVPRGGNTSGEFDYARAKSDATYFKEVMADPTLKAKYNERMLSEL